MPKIKTTCRRPKQALLRCARRESEVRTARAGGAGPKRRSRVKENQVEWRTNAALLK
jgi:hypothetical protein